MFKDLGLHELFVRCSNYCKRHGNSSYGHTYTHSFRVLKNALRLARREHFFDMLNWRVVIVSILLHDISRSKGCSGPNHGKVSFLLVKDFVVNELGFAGEELMLIEKCITHHSLDDKRVHKSSEEKTVYDADKLDGFGFRGLWRITVYHKFEKHKSWKHVLEKMRSGMMERKNNLHFDSSRKDARVFFS